MQAFKSEGAKPRGATIRCVPGGVQHVAELQLRRTHRPECGVGVPITDGRRVEVVANGLPLFGGVQLAIDTTLMSTLHCDGSLRRGVAHTDGEELHTQTESRWLLLEGQKERTHSEFVGLHSRARLVVLVGGRQKLVRSSRNFPRWKSGANRPSYREGRFET